uniref:CRISPR-associated endonuclease Cas2 n=1 Tax=Candidatus Fimenecus sp. TaxID=3022888 RepID=UPI004026C3CB
MNNRFMRLIVFFDLPIETQKNRNDYAVFRRYLIKNGFIMMQKSVYSKLVLNGVTSRAVREKVRQNLPPEGLVEMLEVTENQFSRIEYMLGDKQSTVVESMDRLIEI